jgi:hypothetical protein
MPFSTVQAIENTERTASLGRIASRPDGPLGAPGERTAIWPSCRPNWKPRWPGNQAQGNRHAPRARRPGHQSARGGFFRKWLSPDEVRLQAAFDRIAGMLRKRDYRLRIEGHTDNAPIHTAVSLELGTLHLPATEIVRLLIVGTGSVPIV